MGYLSRILGRIYFRTGAHSGAIEINWSLMKFFASIVVSYFFFFPLIFLMVVCYFKLS